MIMVRLCSSIIPWRDHLKRLSDGNPNCTNLWTSNPQAGRLWIRSPKCTDRQLISFNSEIESISNFVDLVEVFAKAGLCMVDFSRGPGGQGRQRPGRLDDGQLIAIIAVKVNHTCIRPG